MLKILGIAILLVSGIGVAVFLSKEEDKKLLRVRAWLELVLLIRSSVDSYSMAISKILSRCDGGLLLRLGYLDAEVAPRSLSELIENVDIPDEESETALRDLANDFGKNYREHQVSRCDDCIRRLREREADIASRLPSRKKVIFTVTLCAVAAVVILLL